MFHYFIVISNILLISNVVAGTILFLRQKRNRIAYIVGYLLLMLAVEVVAEYLAQHKSFNLWVYIISSNLEVLFFLYFFRIYLNSKSLKRMVLWASLAFESLFALEYLLLSDNWGDWPSYSLTLGYTFVILLILYLYIEMFRSDRILVIHRYLIFWVSTGALIYVVATLPLNLSLKVFFDRKVDVVVYLVQYIANYIMYICFLIGFIWNNKLYKLSL